MVYLITYDLNKEGQEYESIIQSIKSNCSEYIHLMQSTFLVKTYRDEIELRNSLAKVIDENDLLFIVKVQKPYSGYLTDEVWKWLSKNVD